MSEQKRAPRRAAREEAAAVEVEGTEMPETEIVAAEPSRAITVQHYEAASTEGDQVVPQVVPADVFPDFAVTLKEANRRVQLMKEFVREHMVEGEDYGVIPGASPKPTLFKAGAEKLNAIFGLAPIVEITGRVEDWDAGFMAYEVKVTLLNKRTQAIEAEGVGHCNSRERKYKSQDAANVANTILKMAKKRALIDATLSATRASGIFTQDLEDVDVNGGNGRSNYPSRGGYSGSGGSSYGNGGGGYNDRSGYSNRGVSDARSEAGRAPRDTNGGVTGAPGGNGLTEAQRGAILAMANKAFGRNVNEEMARLVSKPIAQLSKGEASTLIDQLRNMLPEREGAPAREDAPREPQGRETFKRSNGSGR